MLKIAQHILLWVGIYVVYTIMLSIHNDPIVVMLINLLTTVLYIIAYYVLRYVQIPYLYNKNRIGLFVGSIIFTSLILYGMYRLGFVYGLDGIRGISSDIGYTPLGDYLVKAIRFYSPAMALLALESFFEGKKEQVRIHRLEKEKLANELKFLKAQINPHFLFNTLNNLYSYILTESPLAPDMILRLSGILDYILYRSQNPTVLLSEEVKTIEHFIALEKIRYGERLEVNLQVDGELSIPISPLLLLSLVENAFMHGASGDIDQPKIHIHIFEENKNIHCQVWNTKNNFHKESNKPKSFNKERGLTNIQRQLELVYPDRHELRIVDRESEFKVNLKIRN